MAGASPLGGGGDPWAAFGSAIGSALGAGPSTAGQSGVSVGITMDGAGWTVATGGSKATGGTVAKNADVPATVGAAGQAISQALGGMGLPVLIGLGLGAVLLIKLVKK